MLSTLTTCYLFLGGSGAGALAVLSVLELADSCRRSRPRDGGGGRAVRGRPASVLPDDLFARCWPLCLVILAVGALCLFVDVGRPDRVLNLLVSPTVSAIAVGAWSLAAAIACAAFFAARALFDSLCVSRCVVRVVATGSIVAGLVVMAYTGVLLQGMASVLAWRTPLLPLLFVTSSLSCGVACVFLGTAFAEARHAFLRPIMRLANIDGALIIAEAACLALYLAWGCADPGVARAADALIAGDLSGYFWGGLVVLGLAVPFAMERLLTYGSHRAQLLWIAFLLLLGGFVLRYCIVGMAQYDVTQMSQALYGLAT